MTNKEAIAILSKSQIYLARRCGKTDMYNAVELALKALEQVENNAKYGSELARIVADHDAADELMKKAGEEANNE